MYDIDRSIEYPSLGRANDKIVSLLSWFESMYHGIKSNQQSCCPAQRDLKLEEHSTAPRNLAHLQPDAYSLMHIMQVAGNTAGVRYRVLRYTAAAYTPLHYAD